MTVFSSKWGGTAGIKRVTLISSGSARSPICGPPRLVFSNRYMPPKFISEGGQLEKQPHFTVNFAMAEMETMGFFSGSIPAISLLSLADSSSSADARSFAFPAKYIASAASLSVSDASYSSYVNPTTSNAMKNFLARECGPLSSLQSKYTSPDTPTRTAINPGCLQANVLNPGMSKTSNNDRAITKRVLYFALFIWLMSRLLRMFIQKRHWQLNTAYSNRNGCVS